VTERISRRDLLKASAVGAPAALLAACGPVGTSSAPPASAAASSGASAGASSAPSITPSATPLAGQLSWLTWTASGPYTDLPAKIIEAFTKKNPGVTISLDQQPAGAPYLEKLVGLKATGRVPDIIADESGSSQTLAQKGITLDLTTLFAQSPDFPVSDFYSQMIAAGSTVALGGMPAGELHLLGMSVDVWMILFNLDMLQEANLPVPEESWTYTDLADYARKLTKRDASGKTTRWGLSCLPDNADQLANTMAASGSKLLDDATQTLPADEKFAAALDVYWAGVKDGSIISAEDVGALGGDWQAAFVAGKSAMLQGAIWSTPSIKDIKSPWDVNVMPVGPGGQFSAGGCAGWAITKDSQNQALAWELMKFIFSPEGFAIWTTDHSVTPPKRSLKDTPWAPPVPHAQRYIDAIQHMYIQPRGPVYDSSGIWYSGLADTYNEYVVQKKPLATAVADLKAKIDAGLKTDPAASVPVPNDPVS
jgi:multiple sugar transport system substrate-binding protein